MSTIKVIGQKSRTLQERFDALSKMIPASDDVITWVMDDALSLDELMAIANQANILALPVSLIQSAAHFDQLKAAIDTAGDVKWVNPLAHAPHFHALSKQLIAAGFKDKAINRLTLYKHNGGQTNTLTQELLSLYMWLDTTMSPIESITAVKRDKANRTVIVLSVKHEQGTITNVQIIYSDAADFVELEVTGERGMLVQRSDSECGAVVLSQGKSTVLDSVATKMNAQNLWYALHEKAPHQANEVSINTALAVVRATETSLISQQSVAVKGGNIV
ncbi:hypothetical protein GCM10012290_00920 [Halolactibacillus alkaliphilus]|uniref:Gfo/Idh/MocA-like oxidoreductase N-terminal domain-containing protein n=1 Tax=Halolactibacillus alkaliphilus TaxID=442899 RepID=A0A511WYH7_9BACI|nr:hypothetical protein [Halolactibacillus alkaliphilus]GEN55583.1 hypothetical protein HAL01_00470 [Halolactibacillus alkaliphilus]GGN63893.1 hypothetical protein GCM10012290_00920 [Halolactibacillus alkaliphilus]SFO62234.1 hypothetical protein SAMN05720591_101142 [Halolactibacillus alkaliphilus]